MGLAKPAVSELIKLIQEKKSSPDKSDLLICAQAINTLGEFGPLARDVSPQLEELRDHSEIVVKAAAIPALTARAIRKRWCS